MKRTESGNFEPLLVNYVVVGDEGTRQFGSYREYGPGSNGNTGSGVDRPKSRNSISAKSKSKSTNAMKMQKVDKMAPGLKAERLKQEKDEKEKKKRMLEDERMREAEELKRNGGAKESAKNIVMPTYNLDTRLNVYREMNMPPSSIFISLGWDESPDQGRKHYRRFYPDELENITEVMPIPTPFQTYNLKRGQSRGASSGFFSFGAKKTDDSGAVSTE